MRLIASPSLEISASLSVRWQETSSYYIHRIYIHSDTAFSYPAVIMSHCHTCSCSISLFTASSSCLLLLAAWVVSKGKLLRARCCSDVKQACNSLAGITYFHLSKKISILLLQHSHRLQFVEVLVGVLNLDPHALQLLKQLLS